MRITVALVIGVIIGGLSVQRDMRRDCLLERHYPLLFPYEEIKCEVLP